MSRASGIRGSGVRHTLPFVGAFSGLWLVVSVAAVLVAGIMTFLYLASDLEARLPAVVVLLTGKTALLITALVALAVFTTHRLAGPWIALRRALRRVAEGDLDVRLALRRGDTYLEGVEEDFEAMMAALRERFQPASEATSTPPVKILRHGE